MTTKKLTLDVLQPEGGLELTEALLDACDNNSNGSECLVIALAPAAISVGSFIVSGSIVIIGNSIHWIEEQGRCEESFLRRAVSKLAGSAKKAGGYVIKSGTDLLHYFGKAG